MAKNNNLGDFLTDIANTIRTKKGTTGTINAQNFSSEIASLDSNPITVNGISSATYQLGKFYKDTTTDKYYIAGTKTTTVNNWVGQMSGLDTGINFNAVTYGNGRFVCVGNSGKSYYSTNGTSWIAMSGLDTGINFNAVTYGNGRFVCVGASGKSYYSTNGTSWIAMSGLDTSRNYFNVTYGNGRFVCLSYVMGISFYSTNGTSWTAMTGVSTYVNGVTLCNANGTFIAVGDNRDGSYYNFVFKSTNGTSWTEISNSGMPDKRTRTSLVYGDGKLILFTENNAYISYDLGVTWSLTNLSGGNYFYGVYGNGKFVCVGRSGVSYYSTDGVNWTAMSGLDTSYNYTHITYGNGRLVCVGASGKSYYSVGSTFNSYNEVEENGTYVPA